MRKRVYWILVALFSLMSATSAEESGSSGEETIKVIATGTGKDSDAALKNALRSAVSQAVGTLVDTQTMVENDEVIKDQILSHSGGFVEKYDIIGSPDVDDGLVTIKIDAVVKKMNLRQKMEAANIIEVQKIDGQLFTRQVQVDDANAMFYEMVKDFPLNCLTIKINGKPYYDEKKKVLVVEVKTALNVEMVNDFTKKLAAFLETALPEAPETINTNPILQEDRADWGVPKESKTYYYPIFMNAKRTMVTWKAYHFTDGMIDVLKETLFKKPTVTIDLTIAGDITIASKTCRIPIPYRVNTYGTGWSPHYAGLVIMPMLDAQDSGVTTFVPAKPQAVVRCEFDLTADDIKQIKDVKMRME